MLEAAPRALEIEPNSGSGAHVADDNAQAYSTQRTAGLCIRAAGRHRSACRCVVAGAGLIMFEAIEDAVAGFKLVCTSAPNRQRLSNRNTGRSQHSLVQLRSAKTLHVRGAPTG